MIQGSAGVLVWVLDRYERLPFILRLAATVAFAVLIWIASSQTFDGPPSPRWKSWLFNGLHVGIYFVLGGLLFCTMGFDLRRRAIVTVILCAIYGAIDEWHQSFVPGRHASALDWISDVVGGLLAVSFLLYLRTREARTGRAVLGLALLGVLSATAATFY